MQTTAVSINNAAPRRTRWGRKEWSQALLRAGRQNNVLFTHAADVSQEVCVLARYISQGDSSGLGIKAVSDSSILPCSCI